MTRKDTILIAVVINAGLLAILFATAVIYDEEEEMVQSEFVTPRTEALPVAGTPSSQTDVIASTGDEVDNVLKYYNTSQAQATNEKNFADNVQLESPPLQKELKTAIAQDAPKQTTLKQELVKSSKTDPLKQDADKASKTNEPLYHIVKKGESPWKIAKQYGVKYEDILRLNNLDEDKARNLKVGDRIRVK